MPILCVQLDFCTSYNGLGASLGAEWAHKKFPNILKWCLHYFSKINDDFGMDRKCGFLISFQHLKLLHKSRISILRFLFCLCANQLKICIDTILYVYIPINSKFVLKPYWHYLLLPMAITSTRLPLALNTIMRMCMSNTE